MKARQRAATRRVTANLPVALLERARRVTGKGITETLVEGLELVRRASAAARARTLRGRLRLDLDLEASRERPTEDAIFALAAPHAGLRLAGPR